MTNEEFFKQIEPIIGKAKSDGDCFLSVHFSLSQDQFEARHCMDRGDALIVIDRLIAEFKLDRKIIASMEGDS